MTLALRTIAQAIARGVAPDQYLDLVEWAAKNIVVPDGPYAGQKWDPERTPYVWEILRHLSPESPVNCVTVRASAQIAKTMIGLIWIAYTIDVCPRHMMVVFPSIKALYDFNQLKLQPMIDASPCLKGKVWQQQSRSGKGSTTFTKRFPGGSIVLATANSPSDLRSKTVPYVFCDEIDEWETNLGGQGDPMKMVDARQLSFHTTGEYKKFECSTPTIEGQSRIDTRFAEGDQRYLQMPCAHCGEYQRFVFKNLKFNRTYPYNAQYMCEHCGVLIERYHLTDMLRQQRWVATKEGPGRHPSYQLDTLFSPFVPWDDIAKQWWEAHGDNEKLKTFDNLWLGKSFPISGESPDWERLMALREDYPPRTIPAGALVITGAADVQKLGIYYEVVAWGPGKTSWSIETDFIPGDTADETNHCWRALDEVRARKYEDAYGNLWGIDAFGVDAGYNTGAVKAWVRRWPQHDTYAVTGEPGWRRPAINTPKKMDINARGEKQRRGLLAWEIGTYMLKAELYANLKKKGIKEGQLQDPAGYCHFGLWQDERYFQQLTSEYVGDVKNKAGYVERRWVLAAGKENHFLDCRVYAMAMAERVVFNDRLGISQFTDDDWRALAAIRSVPPQKIQGDLFDRMGIAPPPARAAEEHKPKPTPEPTPAPGGGIREHTNLRY